ncbi:uncharacterized protein METZ01_LOCUS484710 [marine metagenome]|uniref:Uncharacterized protein n=1 Tax=marine metagenome TaxID=408172 RepID=A0A383CHJ7_9ZZZZ
MTPSLNHPVGEIAGQGENILRYAERLSALFQGVVGRVTGSHFPLPLQSLPTLMIDR